MLHKEGISPDVYATVLRSIAILPADQRFRFVADYVLRQALQHLALTDSLGLRFLVLRCLLLETRVACLYTCFGLNTPSSPSSSWPPLELHGAESLAGYAVKIRHSAVSQDTHVNPEHLPIRPDNLVKSAAVYPLLQGSWVAGCLQICSTSLNYFSPRRLDLLSSYAHLLSLAFLTHEFYDAQESSLDLMPDLQVQQPVLASFRPRVNELLRTSPSRHPGLTLWQAEHQILQAFAKELADLLLHQGE